MAPVILERALLELLVHRKIIIPGPMAKPPVPGPLSMARRVAEIEPFEVMDVLARAHALVAQGRHVVHMEIGEPDFTAPPPVVEAGVRALREGRTAYTATLGLPALREAIARHYQEKFRIPLEPHRGAVPAGAPGGLPTLPPRYVAARDRSPPPAP